METPDTGTHIPPELGKQRRDAAATLSTLALAFYSFFLFVAIGWIYFREGKLFPTKYLSGNTTWTIQVLWGVSFGLASIALSLWGHFAFECVRQGERDIKRLLGKLSLPQIFFLALCSGIIEEIFFRAAMQPTVGIWITSIIFGAMHCPFSKNLFFYPYVTAIIGLGLGWMFSASGEGLCAPVIAHVSINLVGLYRIDRLPCPPAQQTSVPVGFDEQANL